MELTGFWLAFPFAIKAFHSIILNCSSSPRDSGHAGDSETFDHEAILGSAREAEEFDSLPPEEAKAKLAALIKKMDRDQDNRISKKVRPATLTRAICQGVILQHTTSCFAHLSFLIGLKPPR